MDDLSKYAPNVPHAPMPVVGYASQTEANVVRANRLKEVEERFMRLLDEMRADAAMDQRCVALAVTNLQTAAMWAVRAVFQPTRVSLPEDKR